MIQQAIDFRDESEELYALLEPLKDEDFERVTQFKKWKINDVLTHLQMWNWAADLTLKDSAAFDDFLQQVASYVAKGSIRGFENEWIKGLKGRELLKEWHEDWAYGRKYLNIDLLDEWEAERRAHPQDRGPGGEIPLTKEKEIIVA